jgi:C-terminal processing protease CtpA/Prc
MHPYHATSYPHPAFRVLALALVMLPLLPAPVRATSPDPWTERLDRFMSVLAEHGLTGESAALYNAATEAILARIDPLATPITEEALARMQTHRQGQLYDPGIRLTNDEANVVISHFNQEADAASTALETGDIVLRIDTNEVKWVGLHHLKQWLRAEDDTPLTLVTRSPKTDIVTTQNVARTLYTLPDIETPAPLPFQMGYLEVNRLRPETGPRIAKTLRDWATDGFYGVLLDLRGADGDAIDTIKPVAELFADPGTLLFAYRDRTDHDLEVVHSTPASRISMPVMVLIDADTGGAAEVLAAVLADSVRGVMLFGQTTRGDLLLREPVRVDDERLMHLATRQLVTGNGHRYNGLSGVIPDVHVPLEESIIPPPVRSGRTAILDEQVDQELLYHRIRGDATLRRATDVLLGLKALNVSILAP